MRAAIDNDTVMIIDRPRVLVLAYPDIASSVSAGLRELADAHCEIFHPPSEQPTLGALCAALFPERKDDDNLLLAGTLSFFAWSQFDVVILQDLWLSDHPSQMSRLEFAGRVLASLDNDRGNFATQKIVLVTDPAFFEQRVLNYMGRSVERRSPEEIQRSFDPKNAIDFIPVCSGNDNALLTLVDIVSRRSAPADVNHSHDSQSTPAKRLKSDPKIRAAIGLGVNTPVIEVAAPAIRSMIRQHGEIYVIEDEPNALLSAYRALTGDRFSDAARLEREPGVNIVKIGDTSLTPSATFEDLVKSCKKYIDKDLKRHKNVVIVTDILFEPWSSAKTGVDLIRLLRDCYPNQIGIVAFTNFRTPFVVMSAYHLGADYVVEKGSPVSAHESLELSGADRLLEALAFLCFQRSMLRHMRNLCEQHVCESEGGTPRADTHAELQRGRFEHIMPRHTVSLHLQQEWEDTLYLCRLIQIYSPSRKAELRKILREIKAKYNHD
jgi:hypothetical protein